MSLGVEEKGTPSLFQSSWVTQRKELQALDSEDLATPVTCFNTMSKFITSLSQLRTVKKRLIRESSLFSGGVRVMWVKVPYKL